MSGLGVGGPVHAGIIHMVTPPLSVDRMADACKNKAFARFAKRAVKTVNSSFLSIE